MEGRGGGCATKELDKCVLCVKLAAGIKAKTKSNGEDEKKEKGQGKAARVFEFSEFSFINLGF